MGCGLLVPQALQNTYKFRSQIIKQITTTNSKANNLQAKMKREGRQHGMVRTYRILPDTDGLMTKTPRFVNQIHTQTTAGMFAKVSTKPTNHSKSTGLRNSNNKSKNRNNNRKDEFAFNDGVPLSGVSASDVLNSFDEYRDQKTSGALDGHEYESEDVKEGGESGYDIVFDEDGAAMTTGEMVIEQIHEEDWCFVGADS